MSNKQRVEDGGLRVKREVKKMRRAEEQKKRISRKDAKIKTWRLCVFSEAGVRIHKGGGIEPYGLKKNEKFRSLEGKKMRN